MDATQANATPSAQPTTPAKADDNSSPVTTAPLQQPNVEQQQQPQQQTTTTGAAAATIAVPTPATPTPAISGTTTSTTTTTNAATTTSCVIAVAPITTITSGGGAPIVVPAVAAASAAVAVKSPSPPVSVASAHSPTPSPSTTPQHTPSLASTGATTPSVLLNAVPHSTTGGSGGSSGVGATFGAQKIYDEFDELSKRANRIYSYLAQLPLIGADWQPYFDQAFNVYSKLWALQQQNRAILETRGFQRWEVGELAARIAQLYYFYYLRTSDVANLKEAFTFYNAIRAREYFKVNPGTGPIKGSHAIYIRNLRYHARFLVVCLFLECSQKFIESVVEDMKGILLAYMRDASPVKTEVQRWMILLDEIKTFCENHQPLHITDSSSERSELLSNRLSSGIHKLIQASLPVHARKVDTSSKLKLHTALIVANRQGQVKFSELTLDMLNLMHGLEYNNPPSTSDAIRHNPHKVLLYKASIEQVLYNVAAVHSELRSNEALMLYIAANHCGPTLEGDAVGAELFTRGGLTMFSDPHATHSASQLAPPSANVPALSTTPTSVRAFAVSPPPSPLHPILSTSGTPPPTSTSVLCPGDLLPFMRKAMFVIVDSEDYSPFNTLPLIYTAPFVCMMAPPTGPSTSTFKQGLFSMFLSSPITALCYLTETSPLPHAVATKCHERLAAFYQQATQLLFANESTMPPSFLRFVEDDYLCFFILRFLFCHGCLSLLSSNQTEPKLPSTHPALPSAVLGSSVVQSAVFDMATLINKRSSFVA
ncbi:protein SCAI [Pelomyxa schiedti]|nr:protein SCAI [Pelomyxa schiedti]